MEEVFEDEDFEEVEEEEEDALLGETGRVTA